MFRNFFQKLSKEYVIGGLAISGSLYFGYKNVSEYLYQKAKSDESSQHLNLKKNDLLSENLRKIYNNFNKRDLSLRNGDLVFIKYNLEKLGFLNKYKMLLVRNLSKNRIYDDLGILYCSGDSYYVILLPSVKIRSKTALKELNISEKRSRGVIAVEYDDLVRENHPDLISIRRLICSDSTREKVVRSLKSAVLELKSSVNYGSISTVGSWVFGLPFLGYNSSQFINALTYRDEIEHARRSLNYNASNIFADIQNSFEKKEGTKAKSTPDPNPEDGTEYLIENLINLEKTIKEYDRDLNKYNSVIETFLKKVDQGKAQEGSRLFCTETSLVSKVFSKSKLLPLNNNTRLFNIYNYFQLDSLYKNLDSEHPEHYSRLSSPFNVYTGGVNRIRFQNLKYPQIRDVLEHKI